MRIIDAHTHIFPDKIAGRARDAIGEFYDLPMNSKDASVRTLLEDEALIGAEYMLCCSAALDPNRVESINNFMAATAKEHDNLICFGTMHRDYDNYKEELARAKEMGLRGIKFHNDQQKIDIDDPKMMPIYAEIEKLGLPVLFHCGDHRYNHSAPEKMIKVAKRFEGLTVFGSHFGGWMRWDESIKNPKLPNVYYDTSSSLDWLDRDTALRFIDYFGPDRYFFGTDFPMWDPVNELDRFKKLGLDEETENAILFDNFARIFDLK